MTIACLREQQQSVTPSSCSGLTLSYWHQEAWQWSPMSKRHSKQHFTWKTERDYKVSGSKKRTKRGQSQSRPRTRNSGSKCINANPQELQLIWIWNFRHHTTETKKEEVVRRIYRSLFGSLLYLAKQKRPDIMFTVKILSTHMKAATKQHWMCGKSLLRYLQGSK